MPASNLRYSRQQKLTAFGADGQQRLADSAVLIMGAGGLGAPAAMYLASSGVGQITISDFDSVDATNLPRQILYRDKDVGQAKAATTVSRLLDINPDLTCTAIGERLTGESLAAQVGKVDVVLDCTDNFASRWLINEVCAAEGTALVTGAAIRLEGQLSVFRHDRRTGPCFRCLYSEADENLNDCAGQGILAPVAGTIGCLMATEAIKLLLGLESDLHGQLWIYDATSGQNRLVRIPPDENCPVCSSNKG